MANSYITLRILQDSPTLLRIRAMSHTSDSRVDQETRTYIVRKWLDGFSLRRLARDAPVSTVQNIVKKNRETRD